MTTQQPNTNAADAAADNADHGGCYTVYIDSKKLGPNTAVRRSKRNADDGSITAYIDSKKLGPNTPVRRSKRNADEGSTPFSLARPLKSPTPKKTYRTIHSGRRSGVATNTEGVTFGIATIDTADDDDVDDLCNIFAAKVKV